jgi:hypothetical protein
MTGRIGGLLVATVLATAWVGGCGDDKDKKAADGAGAKPAVAADASPKQVALAWASALTSGDTATARNLTTGTESQMKTIEGMAGMMSASKKMEDAMKEKFGADALKAAGSSGPSGMDADEMKKKVEATEEKIEGDTATLTSKDENDPLVLKKVDGRWKIDLSSAAMAQMEQAGDMFGAMTKAADETTADIKAGKFKTPQEARTAMGMKMMEHMPKPKEGEGFPTPPTPPTPEKP